MVPAINGRIRGELIVSVEIRDTKPTDPTVTRVNLNAPGVRISIIGSALAVIAILAVVGMIWVSGKLIDLTELAIQQPGVQQLTSPEGQPEFDE